MSKQPYYDLNSYLRERFGCRVQKITLDAGLTCPNRDSTLSTGGCIYCNDRGSGTGASAEKSITEQIESVKEFLKKRYKAKKFIAYFQSFSNTYAPVDKLLSIYEEAMSVSDIVGLAIGTRPDCVDEDVLNLITEIGKQTWVSMEYGLQSIHDKTLNLINRGHTYDTFIDAVKRTRERKLDICVHVILGLPGENKDDMLATARALNEMDIQAVKIHLLYIIKNTKMHQIYEDGTYECLTRKQYTEIVGDFLSVLNQSIVVHRLTGDPHPEELIAPLWALDKETNLNAIRDYLQENNLWQGKFIKE